MGRQIEVGKIIIRKNWQNTGQRAGYWYQLVCVDNHRPKQVEIAISH
jgi:hypothetical protein